MSFKISRILHAGYLFECANVTIAFDPIFENPLSKNCYAFPNVEFDSEVVKQLKIDAVFISHYHDDHLSLASLNLLDRDTPIYIFSVFDEFVSLLLDLGFKNVQSIVLFRPILIGPFEILPLEALDTEVDSIFHIQAMGVHVLNVVDSWIGPNVMRRLMANQKWDLVMWPFQMMREIEVIAPSLAEPISEETCRLPYEHVEQIAQLNPVMIVPSSCQFRFEEWSWYNQAFFPMSYARFEQQILDISPSIKTQRLNPGETLMWENCEFKKSERLAWVRPVGDQNLDYEFTPDGQPTAMADIAKRFPALTESEHCHITQFCADKIKRKYNLLPCLDEGYFLKPRSWWLKIYNHRGEAEVYRYRVDNNQMSLESNSRGLYWDWLTEISEAKLWGALSAGESLTSLYVRVTPSTKNVNPLEDPLIRCLYEGEIGSYQKAQLRELVCRF